MTIKYRNYHGWRNDRNFCRNCSGEIPISLESLKKSAFIYGGQQDVPTEIAFWKENNILPFSQVNKNQPSLFKNFEYLESTEKGMVAFYIGMAFAQLHMSEVYGVKQLFHLRNLRDWGMLETRNGTRIPDFWGKGENNQSYVVEAKGTTQPQNFMQLTTLGDAVRQVQAVVAVEDTKTNHTYSMKKCDLKQVVIGTHRCRRNEITQQVIVLANSNCPQIPECAESMDNDLSRSNFPIEYEREELGEEVLKLDSGVLMSLYYKNVLELIETRRPQKTSISENVFLMVDVPEMNCRLGLLEEVYMELKESEDKNSGISVGYKWANALKINQILDEKLGKNEAHKVNAETRGIHLASDGVIIMELKKD